MSSQRHATLLETLFQVLGGSMSSPAEPEGPGCSCEKCEQAWNRNQPKPKSARARVGISLRRMDPG
jgi:hypothetical protein